MWGQKLLQSGVLALADEVDPDAQRFVCDISLDIYQERNTLFLTEYFVR